MKPEQVTGKPGVLLFIHGGVWIVGNFQNHQRLLRDLVVGSGQIGVFVVYTSLPQARFPTQLDQSYAALKWIAAHAEEISADGSRIAVAGNSVGGNMTAGLTLGTKGRLAFALLLYTDQRRSDVVKMGPQAIQQGVFTIDQGKTEGGEEAHLEIPVHPKLREIIDATPTVGVETFLVTHFGRPYTAPGFGNWFRELCDAAGCREVSAHGLRKATARRLAEIGCTAHQIAAITGHASLSEVQRYTKAADRKRMAREAMAKLVEGGW
jgi:integrase